MQRLVRYLDLAAVPALLPMLATLLLAGAANASPDKPGPNLFPLAVWLQDPANAGRFRQAGFNTYVGLWEGPTEEHLATLKKAGMRVVCEQNEVGLRHTNDSNLIAWMHGDEPDNAQSRGARFGFGSPVPAAEIVQHYRQLKAADPSRPVLLNLGQGVAWDNWYGRGNRNHHPEDYPDYLKGCDIASFDIYPVNHESPEVAGNLWLVPHGVERLIQWSGGEKTVWTCIECTAINDPKQKPSPHQVRAEAWMSIIHGSRGLIFFVHRFKPAFREAALLDDPEMLAAITALNRQITELAPVLASPTVRDAATVRPANPEVPVALMTKQFNGATHIFAVAMRSGKTTATFSLKGVEGDASVQVLGEDRTVPVKDGVFKDKFGPWDVHLYRLNR